MDITQKRKKSLISIVYFAVLITAYYLLVKYALWILFPFAAAFLIAMILQKPIRRIAKKTPLNAKAVSVVLVLLILIVIAGVFALAGYAASIEFRSFFAFIREKLSNGTAVIESVRAWVEGTLVHLPKAVSDYLRQAIDGMTASVLNLAEKSEEAAQQAQSSGAVNFSVLTTPLGGIISTAKQIPAILTAILVGVISCFFMTADYKNLTGLLKHSMSEEHEATLVRAKHIIIDVLGKWCKSYALILFVTFCEISAGLWLLKLFGAYKGGYIFVIALCTALLDILPVFGTGTVMVPWAVISLFTHKIGLGIGLIIIYVVITVVRQIIEPKIVSTNVGMHPVITLMAMYLGIQLFGVLGIIILPITLVIIKTLNDEGVIHLWGRVPVTVSGGETEEKPAAEIAADDGESAQLSK